MILKLGMHHRTLKVYNFYINDDLVMTLTYFMAMSNLAAYAFKCLELLQSKKEGKDQESIQSSTTPDPGYQ